MNTITQASEACMRFKHLKVRHIACAALLIFTVSACASISEDQCAAGNWAERGYTDGLKGKSSASISKYADRCSEYGFSVDTASYLRGHRDGVELYCTYEQGFERGSNGSDFNQVCAGGIGVGFAQGYDAGRVEYEIQNEHQNLISQWDRMQDKLADIRTRLGEADLSEEDRKRLRKKERRTERALEDIRIDIRAFERIHSLPRHSFY